MADDHDEQSQKKTATQTLADLVARRKAAAGDGGGAAHSGRRQAERDAAARSLSRSKPALRK